MPGGFIVDPLILIIYNFQVRPVINSVTFAGFYRTDHDPPRKIIVRSLLSKLGVFINIAFATCDLTRTRTIIILS